VSGPGRGGGRDRGEQLAVPEAQVQSYYGRPIVRAPVWGHGIPAYFFTGGLAAGCALLAAGADLTGRPTMRRAARLACLGALGASAGLLVSDLGRPDRFYNMLRLAKPTSPMSMGSWILTAIGPPAGSPRPPSSPTACRPEACSGWPAGCCRRPGGRPALPPPASPRRWPPTPPC